MKEEMLNIHIAVRCDKEGNVDSCLTAKGYALLQTWAMQNTPKGKMTLVIDRNTGNVRCLAKGKNDFPEMQFSGSGNLGTCGSYGLSLYDLRESIDDDRFTEEMKVADEAVLTAMEFDLVFDREISEEDAACVTPGGFRVGETEFDFRSVGYSHSPEHPERAHFELTDFDKGYCGEDVDSISAMDILLGAWDEFFVFVSDEYEKLFRVKSVENFYARFSDGTTVDLGEDEAYMASLNQSLCQD